ncbi:MAG TPA: A24 family peptidase [Burkholderiaceae bacterium]|jgi:prepilin peptidase CpaA|nr:A24 family peptidase [Burkholderiaceae bacterium]
MHEFQSIVELLAALIIDPRTGVLFLLLVLAAIYDIRTYKIPNWLVASGIAFALVYTAVVPIPYQGGVLWALGGLGLGFLLMLPIYAIRAMGAGDVKLMAMIGGFVGLADIFYVVLATFIVGGVAALGFAAVNGVMKRMLGNIKAAVQGVMFSVLGGAGGATHISVANSAGRIPYGVSISIATTGYVVAKQLGFWSVF